MFFRMYRDADDRWHWNLWASVILKIAESADSFPTERDCLTNIVITKAMFHASTDASILRVA